MFQAFVVILPILGGIFWKNIKAEKECTKTSSRKEIQEFSSKIVNFIKIESICDNYVFR